MSTQKSERKLTAAVHARLGLATALTMAALAMAATGAQADSLRVVKDPVTGKLRPPTAAESAALDKQAPARTGRGLLTGKLHPQEIRHADGSVEQELEDTSLQFSVARKASDGSTDLYCVSGPKAAAAVMSGKTAGVKVEKIGKEQRNDLK